MKTYGSFNADSYQEVSNDWPTATLNMIITEVASNAKPPKDHGTRCAIGLLRIEHAKLTPNNIEMKSLRKHE